MATNKASLWPALTARDLMRTDIVTIGKNASLGEAMRLLCDHRISGMPVTDEAGHVIGVVSIRDIAEYLSEHPDSAPTFARSFYLANAEAEAEFDYDRIEMLEESEEPVTEVMTGEIFAVNVDATLQEIVKSLAKHRIHRVLVKDGQKHVGLISAMDVLAALARA
jgi:CBS domain-containing protein